MAKQFGRRRFLGLAAVGAVAGMAGCAGCPTPLTPAPGHSTAAAALAPVTDLPAAPGGIHTLADLLSTPSFYIAHRGSGDNWPEHTMRAYAGSVAAGLKALEVSVWATADGVLVCHHDANTKRMTGFDMTIPRASYAALASLRNNARAWLGPASSLEPIPTLKQVLNAYAATHVIFIEDKEGTNTEALLALMDSYPDSRDHFVWKQPGTSTDHREAHASGYTTWGYFGTADLDKAGQYLDAVDLLGVPSSAPDDTVRQFVATGRPVIAWEVHRRSERDRLLSLGVRGMMCSNVRYVLQREAVALQDSFRAGLRAAGDLPWDAASDWTQQPDFLDEGVRLGIPGSAAYTLGSMGPVTLAGWGLEAQLRWSGVLPAADQGAGLAFGQDDDAAWKPGQSPFSTGYVVELTAGGRLVLYRLSPDEAQPTLLASSDGSPPKPGAWERLSILVTRQGIAITRNAPEGAPPSSSAQKVVSADTAFRGGYFSLIKDDDGGLPVEFRNVRVTSIDADAAVCS